MAEELLLGGQRVLPAVLEARGYRFAHPDARRGAPFGADPRPVIRPSGAGTARCGEPPPPLEPVSSRADDPRIRCRRPTAGDGPDVDTRSVATRPRGGPDRDRCSCGEPRPGSAAGPAITPEQFEQRRPRLPGRQRRHGAPEESFVWGEGSDSVGLLPERTPDQDAGRPGRGPGLGPEGLRRRVRMDQRAAGLRRARPAPRLPADLRHAGRRLRHAVAGRLRHRARAWWRRPSSTTAPRR